MNKKTAKIVPIPHTRLGLLLKFPTEELEERMRWKVCEAYNLESINFYAEDDQMWKAVGSSVGVILLDESGSFQPTDSVDKNVYRLASLFPNECHIIHKMPMMKDKPNGATIIFYRRIIDPANKESLLSLGTIKEIKKYVVETLGLPSYTLSGMNNETGQAYFSIKPKGKDMAPALFFNGYPKLVLTIIQKCESEIKAVWATYKELKEKMDKFKNKKEEIAKEIQGDFS